MAHIVPLDKCDHRLAEMVGGKATGLGKLVRHGLRVPPGFAVTSHAYREFVSATGLDRQIRCLLLGADTVEAQIQASKRIRGLFEFHRLSPPLSEELAQACRWLGDSTPVAVRSSSVSEDAAEASFAGEHDTYLWVRGPDAVSSHVLRCWASLFSPEALAYFKHVNLPAEDAAMGVVVQAMVPAEAAGVMMTIDPVTGDPSQVSIEASYGLGLAVVGGEVTPDRFFVDKVTLETRARKVSPKPLAYRFLPEHGRVAVTEVPPEDQSRPCLTDNEVVEIAKLGILVERALGGAQDIEWAVGPNGVAGREVFLLQTRPETVWSQKARAPLTDHGSSIMDRIVANMRVPMRLTNVQAAPARRS